MSAFVSHTVGLLPPIVALLQAGRRFRAGWAAAVGFFKAWLGRSMGDSKKCWLGGLVRQGSGAMDAPFGLVNPCRTMVRTVPASQQSPTPFYQATTV